jgi:ribosomal protein L14E/L6E/L27E
MKYIQTFESSIVKRSWDDNYIIINDLFIIRRIVSGNDEKFVYINGKKKLVGKIEFKFRTNKLEHFKTYAMLSGIVRILDTKYKNDERIKNFEITDKNNINVSTKKAVFSLLLKKLYNNYDELKIVLELCMKNIADNDLNDLIKESDTIGDLIIKLKEFKKYFIIKQADIAANDEGYMNYKMSKYNI